LSDGEDYELLFAAASRDAVSLADAWRRQFPKVRLSCIGKITAAPGLKLRDANGVRRLEAHGYVHFA
jgi:thiamine monophosphate kinase